MTNNVIMYDIRMQEQIDYDLVNFERYYAQHSSDRVFMIASATTQCEILGFVESLDVNDNVRLVSNDIELLEMITLMCKKIHMSIKHTTIQEFIHFNTQYSNAEMLEMLLAIQNKLKMSNYQFSQYCNVNHMTYRGLVKLNKLISKLKVSTQCRIAKVCNIHPAQIQGGTVRNQMLILQPNFGGEC